MSAFLGIALGLGCALVFTYLAARISVLICNDSIQKAVTDYIVRKRLREVCDNARDQRAYGDCILLPPEFFGKGETSGEINAGGRSGTSAARLITQTNTDVRTRHGAGR
jgi:hypothetical protein